MGRDGLLAVAAGAPAKSGGAGWPPSGPLRFIPVLDFPGVYVKSGSIAYVELLLTEEGMYTRPVAGLNDIGAQLCPPPGPGETVTASVP